MRVGKSAVSAPQKTTVMESCQFCERKLRAKEKLYPIPIVNLYPWITIGMEAMGGKKLSEVVEEENLTR